MLSYFNPRTPCGVRPKTKPPPISSPRFQSTHPVWGATIIKALHREAGIFQSTHPVWGATLDYITGTAAAMKFQSTHPVWGATWQRHQINFQRPDFNPRTPCGVRRLPAWRKPLPTTFQSTHPVWGATLSSDSGVRLIPISIHAPRVGCDWSSFSTAACWYEFQSTHPVWGATRSDGRCINHGQISIHAPRVGCDRSPLSTRWRSGNFNPRTPCGVRHRDTRRDAAQHGFQSTHPVWGATKIAAAIND